VTPSYEMMKDKRMKMSRTLRLFESSIIKSEKLFNLMSQVEQ
jgi:hypothetical protein